MALTGVKKAATAGIDYSEHLGTPPAPPIMAKPITGMVTTTKVHKKAQDEHVPAVSETIHKGIFQDKPSAMAITVEGGRTMNLGNYESAKLGVTITVPCEPHTLNEAYDFATDWISQKLNEAVKAAKGE